MLTSRDSVRARTRSDAPTLQVPSSMAIQLMVPSSSAVSSAMFGGALDRLTTGCSQTPAPFTGRSKEEFRVESVRNSPNPSREAAELKGRVRELEEEVRYWRTRSDMADNELEQMRKQNQKLEHRAHWLEQELSASGRKPQQPAGSTPTLSATLTPGRGSPAMDLEQTQATSPSMPYVLSPGSAASGGSGCMSPITPPLLAQMDGKIPTIAGKKTLTSPVLPPSQISPLLQQQYAAVPSSAPVPASPNQMASQDPGSNGNFTNRGGASRTKNYMSNSFKPIHIPVQPTSPLSLLKSTGDPSVNEIIMFPPFQVPVEDR